MADQRVIVFQPKDIHKYTLYSIGIEDFVDAILIQFKQEFEGQFKLFPYILPDIYNKGWGYTGVLYRRVPFDENDPLYYVEGASLVERVNKIALDLSATACAEFFKGRIEIEAPISGQYRTMLELAYSAKHEDLESLGLKKPNQVIRFFLNLDNPTFEKIVIPHLEALGFRRNIEIMVV